MKTAQAITPRIRFKEFTADWVEHELGDFIIAEKQIASPDIPLYSLTIENGITAKSKRYERSFLVKEKESAYKKLKPNSFAYNPMNLRWGALARHKGDKAVAVSKYYDIFKIKATSLPEYMEPFLTTYKMVQFYDRMSEGTLEEKKRVHFLDFVHFKKPFPSLPEQEKIAGFLTSVDDRIDQLKRKKSLLQDYKKGVMQKLFTQELRFKDDHGKPYPDWEEKKLGELCDSFKSGVGIVSSDIEDVGLYPVYGGNGLRGYSNEFTHDGFYILIGRQGALCGNINRAIGKTFISEHAIAVTTNEKSNNEWLAQLLDFMKLNRLSESSAQPGLAVGKLVKLKINTPPLEEQTKIANFLSTLDQKFEQIDTQITQTQTFKKGLLQQMFV